MKKNDLTELKNLNIPAIEAKVADAKKDLANLVIDKNMSKLGDFKVLDKKRKDVAQMLTVLNQKLELQKLEDNLKKMKGDKE